MRINFWDLAGGGDYAEVRNECYKDAQGGLLIYDSTHRSSFEALEKWVTESASFGASGMVLSQCTAGQYDFTHY